MTDWIDLDNARGDSTATFLQAWDELQRFGRETRARWEGHADEIAQDVFDAAEFDEVVKAAAEDAIERAGAELKERSQAFSDRLLELRKFADDHALWPAVAYIDLSLSRRP